jgi:hypothetical protein
MNAVTPPSADSTDDLAKIKDLTMKMREHEQQVAFYGKQRREILRRLRERNIPFRVLAQSTGVSEQAIYKDVRWGK